MLATTNASSELDKVEIAFDVSVFTIIDVCTMYIAYRFLFLTQSHCVIDMRFEDDDVSDPVGTQASLEVIVTDASRGVQQDFSAGQKAKRSHSELR